MLFQTFTKLTFGLSDILVITIIARNRRNGVSSLFFCDSILRFDKNMLQRLKKFLSNFNAVVIQNSLNVIRPFSLTVVQFKCLLFGFRALTQQLNISVANLRNNHRLETMRKKQTLKPPCKSVKGKEIGKMKV